MEASPLCCVRAINMKGQRFARFF